MSKVKGNIIIFMSIIYVYVTRFITIYIVYNILYIICYDIGGLLVQKDFIYTSSLCIYISFSLL